MLASISVGGTTLIFICTIKVWGIVVNGEISTIEQLLTIGSIKVNETKIKNYNFTRLRKVI